MCIRDSSCSVLLLLPERGAEVIAFRAQRALPARSANGYAARPRVLYPCCPLSLPFLKLSGIGWQPWFKVGAQTFASQSSSSLPDRMGRG
eukprot:6235263-Pyramimonas_sp.AAC.1